MTFLFAGCLRNFEPLAISAVLPSAWRHHMWCGQRLPKNTMEIACLFYVLRVHIYMCVCGPRNIIITSQNWERKGEWEWPQLGKTPTIALKKKKNSKEFKASGTASYLPLNACTEIPHCCRYPVSTFRNGGNASSVHTIKLHADWKLKYDWMCYSRWPQPAVHAYRNGIAGCSTNCIHATPLADGGPCQNSIWPYFMIRNKDALICCFCLLLSHSLCAACGGVVLFTECQRPAGFVHTHFVGNSCTKSNMNRHLVHALFCVTQLFLPLLDYKLTPEWDRSIRKERKNRDRIHPFSWGFFFNKIGREGSLRSCRWIGSKSNPPDSHLLLEKGGKKITK